LEAQACKDLASVQRIKNHTPRTADRPPGLPNKAGALPRSDSFVEKPFMNRDEEHLRLLAIFHYVLAGIMTVFALFPVIHLCVGLFFVFFAPHLHASPGQELPPAWFGWIFIIVAAVLIVTGLTLATLTFIAGRCLSARRHYGYCFVVGCIECIMMPFGTVLGVFTIITLNRESAKALFACPVK
jgi:hypothetical protein